jgi:hypothetical protein
MGTDNTLPPTEELPEEFQVLLHWQDDLLPESHTSPEEADTDTEDIATLTVQWSNTPPQLGEFGCPAYSEYVLARQLESPQDPGSFGGPTHTYATLEMQPYRIKLAWAHLGCRGPSHSIRECGWCKVMHCIRCTVYSDWRHCVVDPWESHYFCSAECEWQFPWSCSIECGTPEP